MSVETLDNKFIEDPNPNYTWACSALTLQTKKEGFFKDYAEQVEATVNMEKFGRQTSDEARLSFCLSLESSHWLEVKPFYRAKSLSDAEGLRGQAELFMQVGNYKAALQLLSRSVVRAPAPGSSDDGGRQCLALSLNARARTLQQMGRPELALGDSQCALAAGLPQGSPRCTLLQTQGRAYEAIGQTLRAKLAYSSAAQLLGSGAEEEARRSELLAAAKRCEGTPVTTAVKTPVLARLPELSGGVSSSSLPGASSLLEVQHSPGMGRFVTARQNIAPGATLAVEPAYVACLLSEKAGTHCHHCFTRLEAPLSCPVCSGVAFCSVECQTLALETYHQVECRFSNLFLGSGMSVLCHLALRIVTRQGTAEKFCELWRAARGPSTPSESPQVTEYRRLLELVGHEKQRTTKDFLHRTLMALFLLKCLQAANFFHKTTPAGQSVSSMEFQVGLALLRHLQILQFNAHEIVETLARAPCQVKGSRAEYLGVGVYTSVALFNHDCYPAVSRSFCGTTILIHSLRPLTPGQMVAENYGPIFTKRTKVERQKGLRSRYWFLCCCQACVEDWPSYDTGMIIQAKNPIYASLYQLGLATMESGNLDEAIALLCKYIDSVHRETSLPDKEICLAMDALRCSLAVRWGTVFVPEIKPRPSKEEQSVQIAELVE